MRPTVILASLATVLLAVTACSSDGVTSSSAPTTRPAETTPPATAPPAPTVTTADDASSAEQRFPDVIDASAERVGDTWTISATLSSPYDSPERYADAWRVVGPDGAVYGERVLTHDHATEQPFTRSESGITIPDGVTEVLIEGRDLEFGYGGGTFPLRLPA